ncbi:MAG: CHAT domain-containing protein [Ktedonobacteraceae bacterium]
MDSDVLLQTLRELSLEDGRGYIQQHIAELSDHAVTGNLLAGEALNQLYTNPAISLKLAEILIFYGEQVQHTLSHALGLKAKGDALRAIGLHQAAIDCLDAAGEEFLSLGDEGNWARSRISWILAAAWLGRVEDALEAATRARETFVRLGEIYWACIIDSNVAYVYEQMGRYHDALKLHENMRSIYLNLDDQDEILIKRAIAVTECNQAIDLALLGNFTDAYQLQQQSHSSFVVLGETSCAINTEMNLADLDYTQGYYGSALQRYYRARDILIQSNVDDPLVLAELKLWMAKCLVKLNRAQDACQLADEAVSIHRNLSASLQTSNALREYATILIASNMFDRALSLLEEAKNLFDKGGLSYYAAITRLQISELLVEMGSYMESYKQALLVKEYFESQGLLSRSIRANLVVINSLVKFALEQKEQKYRLLQEAQSLCELTAQQSRQHNLQEEVYKSYYVLGQIYAHQSNIHKASRYYSAAIVQIEHILNDLSYDLSPSFLHTTWAVYEEMIALCLQQSQIERAFDYLEQARSMALRQYINESHTARKRDDALENDTLPASQRLANAAVLRTQYELKDWQEKYRDYSILLTDPSLSPAIDRDVIRSELKRCETKLSELFERLHLYQSNAGVVSRKKKSAKHNADRVTMEQIRSQLAPDQLLLAYFLHREKLVIFVVTKDVLVSHEVVDGAEQLERLLPLLHAHLQPGGWPDIQHPPQQVIRRLLNKLYNLLIAPVASLLPSPSGTLTIVPFGPMHKLPFHALHDGAHFLIERFQIHYLPASNMLVHVAQRKNERRQLAVDSTVPTKRPLVFGYSGNGQMQRTVNEAKMLAEMLGGQCYLEHEATIAHLTEAAGGSPLIHVATHGHSRLDAPNFSYVLLADGQLNAIDAFSLDLSQCQLVTLSGCETGLSLSGGGDEQLGLGRAFLASGADSLLMSLWAVEDNATNELMHHFYQHLLQGDTKSQALRAAQCHLLYSESFSYAHPYFWAAFRLVGDTDTVNFV